MNTKLIKIIEKPAFKKSEIKEELEQRDFPDSSINTQQLESDTKQVLTEPLDNALHDYPLVQSVGNSGWQVSQIWRDIRVDNFCNG